MVNKFLRLTMSIATEAFTFNNVDDDNERPERTQTRRRLLQSARGPLVGEAAFYDCARRRRAGQLGPATF